VDIASGFRAQQRDRKARCTELRWRTRADRSHVDWVILDSDWEGEFCRVVEGHPQVRLFEGLTRHRVPWIREAERAEILAAKEGACLIEAVEW
jgi:hypothetical protein